ncbi:exopolysaccharide biosynthesis polyprenyl glycosylphosphotransferase [Phenylobacterium sp. LjRoot219]|uniref:exopolysaccharide biosynthesis polyprenyl glycosylphosphotransferase n=1 Tax=Phenylobacterium sp. LjRoot219 TaxID=3342283 RepID=UPI003ED0A7CB
MPDGNYIPQAAEANADRRGPMRPVQLTSPRDRMSGRLLARAFMTADAAFLLLAATVFASAQASARPEALAGALLAWLLLLAFRGYGFCPQEARWRHLATAAAAASAGCGATLAFGPLARPDLAWAVSVVAGLCGLHAIWFQVVARFRAQGRLTPNIVIVGATPAAERLIRWALETKGAMNVLGVFDDRIDRVGPTLAGVPVLGKAADLLDRRMLPYVDRVIIAVPAAATARISQLTDLLSEIPNPIAVLLDDEDDSAARASNERIATFGLQQIAGGDRSTFDYAVKRALDLVVSCAALIFLAPLLAVIAIAIRLDSPGPALFRQKRHGFLNEEFQVLKFRSMRIEAEDALARRQVSANDDRVTRVGRFIRKTSLDELPQLLNVVRGEMSLVGPRPHAIGMLVAGEEARRPVKTYAHRHRIKPGLTGWAAVQGSRGPVDTPQAVQRRVALDLEYIERQSLWFDLRIMFQTLPCLLGDSSSVR